MPTEVQIVGTDFHLNGRPTYPGRYHGSHRVEGLLFNSRMAQALFDDENPATRQHWAYPDTGVWDPERNTSEFCDALPTYRRHGLLAVTIGLQGGGSIYSEPVYSSYLNSAFAPDGTLKPAYLRRLDRILAAADAAGVVVIVTYFYWRQERFDSEKATFRAVENATDYLLRTGHKNIIVDLRNEIREGDGLMGSRRIHELLAVVRDTSLGGRRLYVGVSTHPDNYLPQGPWPEYVDLFMPHGNDSPPDKWRAELRNLKTSPAFVAKPRPICCNEDSIDVANLDVSLEEGVSWGYYDQGYGATGTHGRHDWGAKPRETHLDQLSGFQTLPVNWSINTPHKHAFFSRLRQITTA